MKNCDVVQCPIVPRCRLTKYVSGEKVDVIEFKQIVGSLMYLTTTRLYIMFSTCLISRYMEISIKMHLIATKKVLRYLNGIVDVGV